MRPPSQSPPRAGRRAFALAVALVATFGAVTACSDDGPSTPAISGENPGEVTIPTLPPTTTSTPLEPADDEAPDASAPTTTEATEG